jgi:hypothetical protein
MFVASSVGKLVCKEVGVFRFKFKCNRMRRKLRLTFGWQHIYTFLWLFLPPPRNSLLRIAGKELAYLLVYSAVMVGYQMLKSHLRVLNRT